MTDLDGYLAALDMRLKQGAFDEIGLPRIVQLINKTNQFNLTTRRYGENDLLAIMTDSRSFGLQLRLLDLPAQHAAAHQPGIDHQFTGTR